MAWHMLHPALKSGFVSVCILLHVLSACCLFLVVGQGVICCCSGDCSPKMMPSLVLRFFLLNDAGILLFNGIWCLPNQISDCMLTFCPSRSVSFFQNACGWLLAVMCGKLFDHVLVAAIFLSSARYCVLLIFFTVRLKTSWFGLQQ